MKRCGESLSGGLDRELPLLKPELEVPFDEVDSRGVLYTLDDPEVRIGADMGIGGTTSILFSSLSDGLAELKSTGLVAEDCTRPLKDRDR